VENLSDQLKLPEPICSDKGKITIYQDQRARSWSIAHLNQILQDVLVSEPDGTQIAVVGGAEWESEMFKGVSRLHVRVLDEFYSDFRRVTFFVYFSYVFRILQDVSYVFRM
jgi:hypothetical protein